MRAPGQLEKPAMAHSKDALKLTPSCRSGCRQRFNSNTWLGRAARFHFGLAIAK